MKLTVNNPPPVVQPPKIVILELTEREFAMLYDLARSTRGVDVAREANEFFRPETEFNGTEAASWLFSISSEGSKIVRNFKL